MTRKELNLTRIIHSRGMAILIVIASVFMTVQAWLIGDIPPIKSDMSVVFPPPANWISDSWISMWVNIALITGLGILMIAINRSVNLLRTMSVFFVAFFVFITASTPIVAGRLSGSALLAILVIMSMWIFFSIYSVRPSSRRVFLAFFLLGAGALFQYSFLLYVPVFLIGVGQMRIFRFKKLIAAFLGLITPGWIIWGAGFAPLPSMPAIYFTSPAMLLDAPGGLPFLATVAFTLSIGLLVGMANLIKIIGFNAQARAYNGFLTLISISTGVFAIVNFTNLPFYVTLLNACVAFQVGHFFRFTAMRCGYIFVLSFMAVYLGLYFWSLFS